MKLNNQTGAVSGLLLALIGVSVLLFSTLIFAFWAYGERQDYKNTNDAKVAAAVETAKQEESAAKEKEFAERQKSPYKTYVGPSAYGSISITYPRSWSGYISDTGDNSPYVDGYFSPDIVPDIDDENSSFALRVQVVQDSYSKVLESYKNQSDKVKIQPYQLAKVSSVVGSKISGEIENDKQGTMVILPVRDKTLKVWTESSDSAGDFDKIILANLTFSP